MKVSEVLRLLSDDDWYLATTRGGHRQLKHPEKVGRVTGVRASRAMMLLPGH
jgi:predicted RNA binding protein YcfA (HicA-like mRNA interferase family)